MILRDGNCSCCLCRSESDFFSTAIVTNKEILWLSDTGKSRFINLIDESVTIERSDESTRRIRRGVDLTWEVPDVAGDIVKIPKDHALFIRLSPEGILLYTAVAVPSEDVLDLFTFHPAKDLTPRGRRAWARSLRGQVHNFTAINGATDVNEFVQFVQFPIELIIVEEENYGRENE